MTNLGEAEQEKIFVLRAEKAKAKRTERGNKGG